MSKKKKKKKNGSLLETKGLIFIILGLLFFISLFSFENGNYPSNYLGIIGYSLAWISISMIGLSSYIISIYMLWIGIKYLKNDKLFNLKRSLIFLSLLIISSSILLTVFSETRSKEASIFATKIFTTKIFAIDISPEVNDRYNLGGIPFYFLYKDIPIINLKKLLSNVGIVLISSSVLFISFLMLSNVSIIKNIKVVSHILFNIFIKIPKKFLELIKKIAVSTFSLFKKKKKQIEYQNISSQINISSLEKNDETNENLTKKNKINLDEISTKVIISRENKVAALKNKINIKKLKEKYHLPPPSILSSPPPVDTPFLKKELGRQAQILEQTLNNFGIKAKVGEINCGPTITSFEVHPDIGVKVQRIKALENDIALNLQAKSIRIIAPIPGKAAVGVEIPSLHPQPVSLKEMLLYYHQNKRKHSIPLLLGKTVSGDHVITDLAKMPHLLIAGATGSGKSVCINTLVMSILMNLHPDDVKLMMIDPKKVELTQYSNLPHMIAPVITEAHGAYAALQWLVKEMQKRYDILKQLKLRNITAFNHRKIKKDLEESLNIEIPDKMPQIVAIVDEFADLMMVSSSDLETPIARIAQMARAVGIHLILATQRPSREVITGIIKANFPSRIAFKVASRINSQIILDETGAETLLGNGDMLFLPPGSSHLARAQGAFISDDDINKVIEYLCNKYPASYLIPSFDALKTSDPLIAGEDDGHRDKLYNQALEIVLLSKNASTTFLQRKLKIGYARAASLIDELEENNIISPADGGKRRIIANIDMLNK